MASRSRHSFGAGFLALTLLVCGIPGCGKGFVSCEENATCPPPDWNASGGESGSSGTTGGSGGSEGGSSGSNDGGSSGSEGGSSGSEGGSSGSDGGSAGSSAGSAGQAGVGGTGGIAGVGGGGGSSGSSGSGAVGGDGGVAGMGGAGGAAGGGGGGTAGQGGMGGHAGSSGTGGAAGQGGAAGSAGLGGAGGSGGSAGTGGEGDSGGLGGGGASGNGGGGAGGWAGSSGGAGGSSGGSGGSGGGEWQWAKRAGGAAFDSAQSIAALADGSSYVAGSFSGTAAFGGTTLTSAGGIDAFLAKYDSTGKTVWAKRAGGVEGDYGDAVAVRDDGTAYVTGSFRGSAVFGSTTLNSAGRDAFLAKYDSNGTVIWARSGGGESSDQGSAVAVLGDGSAIVAGNFMLTATFGTTPLTAEGQNDVFVVKYTAAGDVVWAKRGGGASWDAATSVAVMPDGIVYVAGWFTGSASFGSVDVEAVGQNYDLFVAKLDSDGEALWVAHADVGGDPYVYMTHGGDGSTYVVATFNGTPSGPLPRNRAAVAPKATDRVLVASYDSEGDLRWFRSVEGASVGPSAAVVTENDTLYVTGSFAGSATFGSKVLTSASTDLFLVAYDAGGDVILAERAGKSGGVNPKSLAFDDAGAVYVVGAFTESATFGSTTLTAAGSENDAFLAKWR